MLQLHVACENKVDCVDFTWPNTPRLEATRLVIKLVIVLYITPFAQRIEKCLRVLWPCTPLLVLDLARSSTTVLYILLDLEVQ